MAHDSNFSVMFLMHVYFQSIIKMHPSYSFKIKKDLKCPRILVTMTNFVMVFINGGISYISIRLLTFITYVHCIPSVYLVMGNCE